MPLTWDNGVGGASARAGTSWGVPNLQDMAVHLRVVVAFVLAVGLFAPSAGARTRGEARGVLPHHRVDRAEDCDNKVPAAFALRPTGNGQPIALDILILHDGIEKPAAEAIVTSSQTSFSPLNVKLVPTYKKVTLSPAEAPATAGAGNVIAAAKLAVGGARPTGIDVVHVLTTKDITLGDDRDAVGYADCIGGVRYPGRAFSASEAVIPSEGVGPLNFYIEAAAETLSHEVGHLLGARHEHSNCAEGIGLQDASNREPSACTVMINYVDLQSLNFGTPEALVVRAHAETYAAP